jgi:hypothetical protein
MIEREEAERKTEAINNRLNDLANKVTTITGTSITGNTGGLDLLITKVTVYFMFFFIPI